MKRYVPATARNSAPLAAILERELPSSGMVLEVASGTGEHALFMANRFPNLTWQPSDREASSLDSIAAWSEEAQIANITPPIALDAAADAWPVSSADSVLCVNMVHISPWSATEGLFEGASRLLVAGAPLIVYGPYFEEDVEPAASNIAFDIDLRRRDPQWGIRNIEQVDALGENTGFVRTARHAMPANNLTLVYRKS